MPASWILFDVGGVLELVDDEAWPVAYVGRCADRLGISAEEFEARLDTVRLPDASIHSGVEEEFWQVFASAVGAGPALLPTIRDDFWDSYCGTVNSELINYARSLMGQVGLAILSNSADGAREQEEQRFGFSAIFDPIRYSHEIGVNKPDLEAYRIAVTRMETEPGSVLFIDNRAANVEAARRFGMRAWLHQDNPATIAMISGWLSGRPEGEVQTLESVRPPGC